MNEINALKNSEDAYWAEEGIYVYCIADGEAFPFLKNKGLEGCDVWTYKCMDLFAVLQNCPTEYLTKKDEETLKAWVLTHQKVIDEVSGKSGALLPFGFGKVLNKREGLTPIENLKNWIEQNHQTLKEKLERVRGKDEYGIQVFLDASTIQAELAENSIEITRIKNAIASSSEGVAFLYQEKLSRLVSAELERKAGEFFSIFYSNIKEFADEIKMESTKNSAPGKKMIMNLSCLVSKEQVQLLGYLLEDIEKDERFNVRFTGPWAPYSFV